MQGGGDGARAAAGGAGGDHRQPARGQARLTPARARFPVGLARAGPRLIRQGARPGWVGWGKWAGWGGMGAAWGGEGVPGLLSPRPLYRDPGPHPQQANNSLHEHNSLFLTLPYCYLLLVTRLVTGPSPTVSPWCKPQKKTVTKCVAGAFTRFARRVGTFARNWKHKMYARSKGFLRAWSRRVWMLRASEKVRKV
jgi:hypothetical protein